MKNTCNQCQQPFEITDADLAFYDKVSPLIGGKKMQIPPPTLCPPCRRQRRMTWRNEHTLHKRLCNFSGRQMLSLYRPDIPYTVYGVTEWYSGKWDAADYGREFDFSRPFFEQFDALQHEVPLLGLYLQSANENCDYTNLTTRNRDCYLIFAANDNRDCYYCNYMHRSTDMVDCFFVMDCERCYECVDCQKCTNLRFSEFCESCVDSSYLKDCKSCTNCFGCVGLVQKQHHLFNEALSSEEYASRVKELMQSPDYLQEAIKRIDELVRTVPHKYYAGMQNENCTGDHLVRCRNVSDCYDCTDNEDCRYCTWLHQAKDCYDCYAWGLPGELGYESHLLGNGFYNVQFSEACWNNVRNLLYCRYCISSSDCFGCISMQRKKFCILNKQYTQEDYEKLVPKIVEHMRSTAEFGEFFPSTISPFPYNDTQAQEYFPLPESEIRERGLTFAEEEFTTGRETLTWDRIAADSAQVPDSVTEEILSCESCNRNFRIIPQELKLYREMHLPVPHRCFDCRYKRRRELRNPRKLWDRECMKCSKTIKTSYAPERPEKIYCEQCYLDAVY